MNSSETLMVTVVESPSSSNENTSPSTCASPCVVTRSILGAHAEHDVGMGQAAKTGNVHRIGLAFGIENAILDQCR